QWHGICALREASARKDPWSAIEHGNTALRLAKAVGHPRYLGLAQAYLGMNLWFIGALEEAERTLMEITLPDEELGFGLTRRFFSLAWLFADKDRMSDARLWADRLVEAGVARRVKVFEGQGRWALAEVLRRTGEVDAAEQEITAALPLLGLVAPIE